MRTNNIHEQCGINKTVHYSNKLWECGSEPSALTFHQQKGYHRE